MSNTKTHPTIHGHARKNKFSPTYQSWSSMLQRCTNPNRFYYHRYGGRGIKVCTQWKEFSNFLADMGVRPVGTSLERLDTDDDYTPKNCKWATPIEQMNNTSTNVQVTIGGETKTVATWIRVLNLNYNTIRARIRKWGDPYIALTRRIEIEKRRK